MSKRILIVDDEPNVRLNYRMTLETEGFAVTEADCGAKALEQFAGNHFDLAILDMRMPEMDGLDLLAEMRQRGLSTPTVIITAYGDIPHAVRAMKLGAIDFLKKPMTPELLRHVVEDVLLRHAPEAATSPKMKRDDFEMHLVSAKRLLNLRDFAGAKKHLARALELNSNADAFNLGGMLFEMQEDYVRAKHYYSQAIRLDKHHEAAEQNMLRIIELFNSESAEESFTPGD